MTAKKSTKKKTETPKKPFLNPKQELFCRYYAQGEGTFGNATLSYAAAYDYELGDLSRVDYNGNTVVDRDYRGDYSTCASEGSKLLKMPKVQNRITELLNELLKDEIVDAELVKVIKQDEERAPKVQAIREFNKLRGRIIEKSQSVISQKLDLDDLRTIVGVLPEARQEEFYALINEILKEAEQLRRSGGKVENSSTVGF